MVVIVDIIGYVVKVEKCNQSLSVCVCFIKKVCVELLL
jgi:hypothetical protein